ncbi:MAG: hypothetical protein AAF830_07260 [Pseudomonadota bacterium]
MFPFEDDPEPTGEKNTLGVIDGALTSLALAAIALVPTVLSAVFWPRALAPMIAAVEPQGRRGLLLAPGAFFVLGLITSSVAFAALAPNSGGTFVAIGSGVGTAASDGQVWAIATLFLPLFFVALFMGLVFHLPLFLMRVGDWPLVASIRAGFYAMVGFAMVLAPLEVFALLMLSGTTPLVRELTVLVAIGLFGVWFFFSIQNEAQTPFAQRLAASAFPAGVIPFAMSFGYSLA